MKHCVFVMGPACAGKSTYIKENYPDYKVVDLFDFQKNGSIFNVWDSYVKCEEALEKALQENDKVVLEHTLLKAMRRPMYIEVAKKYVDQLTAVCILPDVETLKKQRTKRMVGTFGSDYELSIFDMPTQEDGFDEIIKVGNYEAPET